MTPDEFWEHEFGNTQYARDFAGRPIMKKAFKNGSIYEWDLDHILPLKLIPTEKSDNINNWQIVHVETNREKSHHNPFHIGNKRYQLKKVQNLFDEDKVAPYPYQKNGKQYCVIIMENINEKKIV